MEKILVLKLKCIEWIICNLILRHLHVVFSVNMYKNKSNSTFAQYYTSQEGRCHANLLVMSLSHKLSHMCSPASIPDSKAVMVGAGDS